MNLTLDCYNDSFAAFERWNLTDFSERKALMTGSAATLPEQLNKVFLYQQERAAEVVSAPQSLVSPTGETNELYTRGRGVALLLADSDAPNSSKALVAMMTALLAAGNSVIVCSDNIWLNEIVEKFSAGLPDNLVQLKASEHYCQLLKLDIRNFVYIGSNARTAQLSQELAMRNSAITTMVAETNLETLPHSKDPMLVLRFITEKVRSINITAIGGNAMLLELGNTAH